MDEHPQPYGSEAMALARCRGFAADQSRPRQIVRVEPMQVRQEACERHTSKALTISIHSLHTGRFTTLTLGPDPSVQIQAPIGRSGEPVVLPRLWLEARVADPASGHFCHVSPRKCRLIPSAKCCREVACHRCSRSPSSSHRGRRAGGNESGGG